MKNSWLHELIYWAPTAKPGGGWIAYKDSPSPPAAPDYAAAATAQGVANKDAAIATAQLSNPNVTNPYGGQTVSYSNDPTTGNPVPNINQYLSPSGQSLFDQYQGINKQLGNVAEKGVGYVNDTLNQPFNFGALPKAPVNAGQSYQEAAFSRLQPNMDQARSATETQLSNQGITQDSNPKAWENAQREIMQRESDQRAAITTSSIGQDQAARQAAIQEQEFGRTEPLNILNAVRSSAPVNVPQFQQYSGSQVAPAPVMQGAMAQGQAGQNLYNAQQAGSNAEMSGLFSLGGAGMQGFASLYPYLSDRRLKSNIRRIGTHARGFGVYEYDIAGLRAQGVMADEVQKIMPEAVVRLPSGYLAVFYGML